MWVPGHGELYSQPHFVARLNRYLSLIYIVFAYFQPSVSQCSPLRSRCRPGRICTYPFLSPSPLVNLGERPPFPPNHVSARPRETPKRLPIPLYTIPLLVLYLSINTCSIITCLPPPSSIFAVRSNHSRPSLEMYTSALFVSVLAGSARESFNHLYRAHAPVLATRRCLYDTLHWHSRHSS